METSYINNSPIDQVQFKEFTEEDLKTIGTIEKCFQEFKFKLDNIDQIARHLLTQLKAKNQLDKEEVPYEIELMGQTDGNNTIEKIVYKVNQVFLHCLGLESTYFKSVIERNFRESKEKHLELSNIYAEEFKMLIQNVFQPELNKNNISTLLELSHRFAFSELNKKSEDWLFAILNKEEFPNFMQHLAEHNSPQMLNILAKIAPKHLTELARTSKNDFITLAKLCVEKNLEIKELDLSDSKIDKECLEAIPSTLESLNLSYTSIKDNDLLYFKNLNLKQLDLCYCESIEDAGLENLTLLTNLQDLKLSGCKITDTGLKSLKPLINLKHLDLSNCIEITDAGLESLKPLIKNLQYLNLSDCPKITRASMELLKLSKFAAFDLSHDNDWDF